MQSHHRKTSAPSASPPETIPESNPLCWPDTILSQSESCSRPENVAAHLPPCAHPSPEGNSQPVRRRSATPPGKMRSAPHRAPHSNQFRVRPPPYPNAYSRRPVQVGRGETQLDTDVCRRTTILLPHLPFANEKTFVLHRPQKIRGRWNAAQ